MSNIIEYCVWICRDCGMVLLVPKKSWEDATIKMANFPPCDGTERTHGLTWAHYQDGSAPLYVTLDDSLDFCVEKKVDRFEKILTG